MSELAVTQLSVDVKGTRLVENASFTLRPGQLIGLLGPNGAGKSTLLRASLGLLPRSSGEALLDGFPTDDLSPLSRARKVSYLPQARPLAWPNTVRDVVALGRFSHGVALGRLAGPDLHAVETALEQCDLTSLADRRTTTLSGGELARVHCARAFCAQAPLLIADEPVAALDPRHQFAVLDLIRRFVDQGGGALVVLHDVQLARQYADHLLWMKDGLLLSQGSPEATLTEERLAEIYGLRATVTGGRVDILGPL